MNAGGRKLKSAHGASMVLALLFLLLCMTVAAMILTAAMANAGKAERRREEQQAQMTAASAARLAAEEWETLSLTLTRTETVHACRGDARVADPCTDTAENWTVLESGSGLLIPWLETAWPRHMAGEAVEPLVLTGSAEGSPAEGSVTLTVTLCPDGTLLGEVNARVGEAAYTVVMEAAATVTGGSDPASRVDRGADRHAVGTEKRLVGTAWQEEETTAGFDVITYTYTRRVTWGAPSMQKGVQP